ncbi:MAG: ABC transporter permease [Chloroflexota bacterium]
MAVAKLDSNNISEIEAKRPSNSLWATARRRLARDYLTITAMVILAILTVLSFSEPIISDMLGVNYTSTSQDVRFLPIGAEGHILGTDNLGRDMAARLLRGGQISITVGTVTAVMSMILGVSIGLVAGFYQGGALSFVDDFIMWFVTTLNSIPTLLLLILLTSVLRPSITVLIGVLVFVSWSRMMRLIRGETIALRENEYVLSAKAIGASDIRVMFTHILPNTLSILITTLAIEVGTLILVESALSFLGLGVQPPESSWGNMLTEAQSYFQQAPHMSILPGVFIVITVLSTYLIGDGLRDALDPRTKE